MQVTASSVFGDTDEFSAQFAPQLAIDGKFSDNDNGFYQSNSQQHPWFKAVFYSTIRLTGVRLYNRQDCCGDQLKNVAIRAGITPIGESAGVITQNTYCGHFSGPGVNSSIHDIYCPFPINSNIVTIQIVEPGDQILELDEVQFITEGRDMYK